MTEFKYYNYNILHCIERLISLVFGYTISLIKSIAGKLLNVCVLLLTLIDTKYLSSMSKAKVKIFSRMRLLFSIFAVGKS